MIGVLRLGHRVKRDVRITTHVFLAARAFGADSAILSGEPDDEIIESVGKVSKNWGGKFSVVYQEDWRKVMREAKKKKVGIVHLTMYGELVQKKIPEIRKKWKNLLVVVGAGKVPGEAYRMSDYNISVTSQPHSEVAALAVFLHEYFGGKELEKKFGGKLKIVPKKIGKCVVSCR